MLVELAEAKAKLRRCRQELEEKCEQVAELRDELEAVQSQSARVKQENMDLVQEARLSKALRDELDIVRERASKVREIRSPIFSSSTFFPPFQIGLGSRDGERFLNVTVTSCY